MNSFIDTLPTQNNLKMWSKSFSDKCLLCNNRDLTLYVLNGCKKMLDQGRYTFRHDNILKYITDSINTSKFSVNTDIEGHQTINGGTIAPHLAVTDLKPDIVIMDSNTVNIFELTVPFETNIEKRHIEKSNKYAHLLSDITVLKPRVEAFKIGSRGIVTQRNKMCLKQIYKYTKQDITHKQFIQKISEISIISSYYIFIHRKDQTWITPPLFSH